MKLKNILYWTILFALAGAIVYYQITTDRVKEKEEEQARAPLMEDFVK